ncbi:MAG: hypothetical protein ACOH2V_03810 [Candidatus Saccharimonadaceae bacterium]
MAFKPKRHIVIPIVIIIYTIVIAVYATQKYYTPENKNAYFFVIGVNLTLAIVLYFILKKREDWRNNNKK